MAKIHITLVGGQTTPVYQGIVATNPDRVILIHSSQTEDEANRIYSEMEVDCELRRLDPVDLATINAAVVKLRNSFLPNDKISINVSSGTKPWSLLFYDNFKNDENAQVFVIDQNNQVWNLKTHQSTEVQFDMDVQFRLLGNKLTQYKKIDEYTINDIKVIGDIREVRKFNFQDFNTMTEYLFRYPNETEALGKNGSHLKWHPSDKSFWVNMVNKQRKQLNLVLKSEHIRDLLLNTGWFEFEIASLLSCWKRTTQLRMNCIFPTKNGSPKNEIDIIVNAGNKLLFVECKTQIKNETDIDKFASAVKIYGGLGSKALFVTDAPMTEKAMEKCADNGIMSFCLNSMNSNIPAENVLFEMLNKELFNLNVK